MHAGEGTEDERDRATSVVWNSPNRSMGCPTPRVSAQHKKATTTTPAV